MKLEICAKCSDLFAATLYDDDGNELKAYDGYVPDFMPDGGGDYVIMTIDLNTGQILDWTKPTQEQIDDFINTKS